MAGEGDFVARRVEDLHTTGWTSVSIGIGTCVCAALGSSAIASHLDDLADEVDRQLLAAALR